MMRNIILIFLSVLFLFSCSSGNSNQFSVDQNTKYYDSEIEQLLWSTRGGGSINFEISRRNGNFDIMVSEYKFQGVNIPIRLTMDSANVHTLVDDIFDKSLDLFDETFVPYGLTGTWTSISLIYANGKTVEIKNIKAYSRLHIIPDFIDRHMHKK